MANKRSSDRVDDEHDEEHDEEYYAIDPERGLIEQLEEWACHDDEMFEFLVTRVYPDQGIMSLIAPIPSKPPESRNDPESQERSDRAESDDGPSRSVGDDR